MQTLRECIEWAKDKSVAIGHFNISDSEGFKAVVESAQALQVPVIIGLSEKEGDFFGLESAIALVRVAREHGQPIFLNSDHIYSVDRAKAAIDLGVDSVIIDGANLSFEENVKMTSEVVSYAKAKGTLIEGELGFIGSGSTLREDVPEGISESTETLPEDARNFVAQTGVDLLAPSVGNVHGLVRSGEPKLNIERIKAIAEAVPVPLVLHGASGNTDEDIEAAINAGIRIVHINTEVRLAYREGIKEGLETGEIAPYKFLAEGVEEMKKVITHKLRVFNHL